MTVTWQDISIPLVAGEDSGTAEHALPSDVLRYVENARYENDGRLAKRPGGDEVNYDVNWSNNVSLAAASTGKVVKEICDGMDSLVVTTDDGDVLVEANSAWINAGKSSAYELSRVYTQFTDSVSYNLDCATDGTYIATVCNKQAATGASYYEAEFILMDVLTGSHLLRTTLSMTSGSINSGRKVRVAFVGSFVLVAYEHYNNTGPVWSVKIATLDLSTLTWTAVATIPYLGTSAHFDVTLDGHLFLAEANAGTGQIDLYSYLVSAAALALVGTDSSVTATDVMSICAAGISGAGAYIAMASYDSAGPVYELWEARVGSAGAFTLACRPLLASAVCQFLQVSNGVGCNGRHGVILVRASTSYTIDQISSVGYVMAADIAVPPPIVGLARYGAACVSRLVSRGGHFHAAFVTPSTLGTDEQVGTSRTTIIAACMRDKYNPIMVDTDFAVDAVVGVSDGVTYVHTARHGMSAGIAGAMVVGGEMAFQVGSNKSLWNSAIGCTDARLFVLKECTSPPMACHDHVILPGGALRVVRNGKSDLAAPLCCPKVISETYAGGAPANTWRFTYQVIDSDGGLVESEPSPPYKDSVNKQGTFVLEPPVGETRAMLIVPYRLSGTIYYRVDPLLGIPVSAKTQSANCTWVDAGTSTVTSYPVLYTSGGVLANETPRAASCAAMHGGRLFYGYEDVVFYSHERRGGYGLEFNSALMINPYGGNVLALASSPDGLLIFTERGVFIQNGVGPNRSGTGNDFYPPQLVHDLVCDSKRGVLSTPLGVLVVSAGGIYLLKGSSATLLSDHIRGRLNAYPLVTSCTYLPRRRTAMFSFVSATDVTDGLCVELDIGKMITLQRSPHVPIWYTQKLYESPVKWEVT